MRSLILFISSLLSLLFFTDATKTSEIPPLNQKIIAFVDAHLGKQIGDGQCWALAAQALDEVRANWDHEYRFGKEIDAQHENIYPGDIIQFQNVTIKYRTNEGLVLERYPQHTAIIYKRKDEGVYVIANQNVNNNLTLQLTELHLDGIIKGNYKIYRPQP